MGESDRYGDFKKPIFRNKNFLNPEGNALLSLCFINVAFFLVLAFLKLGFRASHYAPSLFESNILQWLALGSGSSLGLSRPWTLLTYMFCDLDLIRFVVNLIWLWVFGNILQSLYEEVKIIPIYLYGGIIAGIAWVAATYFLKSGDHTKLFLLGANLPTVAVASATTFMVPRFKIMQHINGGISLWILWVIFLAIAITSSGNVAQIIAIGAALLTGFVYVYLFKRGIDCGAWMVKLTRSANAWFAPGNSKKNTPKQLFYETGNRKPYTKTQNLTQKKIDEILDKINQKGYQSLSNEEKELLKKASESDEL